MEKAKSIQIPILKNKKFITKEEGNEIHIWYATNEENEIYEEINIIKEKTSKYPEMKLQVHYDYRVSTQFMDRRWFVWDWINVYENTGCTPRTALIKDNNKSFERVYWATLIPKE